MAELSKQALQVANNTDFPNNSTGYITPAILRSFNSDLIDSTVNQAVYTSNSSSWNSSITNLNAFTSSQQPQFISLNAFTASQLLINSGYNSATQSLDISITGLQSQTAQLSAFTSSINEIRDGGVLQGYSTRFYFGGLVSASIVPNVNGAIASIDILSDNTKATTSSFNELSSSVTQLNAFSASTLNSTNLLSSQTASYNSVTASVNAFTSSAQTSIDQLLNFSSSLDATYATDAQLTAVSSSLDNNINTKLNTSSFNAYTSSFGSLASLNLFSASINSYTASNNTKWTTIGLLTGSYAITGSNVFTGSQTITGSAYGNVVSASISTNTASIDLSIANYFTLTIANNTNINVINAQPGVTATLVINTAGAVTASFSSNVKQPSGSIYVPSISGNIDIVSLTAVTPSTVFVVPAYTFV
jgi:hypothetical protein